MDLEARVFNRFNLALNSTLALTVTGPGGYYYYDFQPIAVGANETKQYSFSWIIPNVAGTYVAELSLVPTQLTAYDSEWLNVS